MAESETVLSILCSGPWRLDSNNDCQIIFSQDGTGELILRHEARAWIGAETEWKCPDPATLDQPIPPATSLEQAGSDIDATRTADVIADFHLDMTLTKRVITTRGSTDGTELNDFYLKPEALFPKKFTACLQRGYFDTAMDEKLGAVPRWAPKYKYRLVFDKSPYPQARGWKEVGEDEQYLLPQPFLPYAEWKEFCCGEVPKRGEDEVTA